MKFTISYLCQRHLSCAQHAHSCRLALISVMFSYPFHLNAQGLLWFPSGDALAWLTLYIDFVELMAAPIDGQTLLFPDEPMGFWKREV